MPNSEQLAAAAFAVIVFAFALALGIGAPWLNIFVRSRYRGKGFPKTRRRSARRKAS